jgi:cytochrome bd-type quinol oxidase subunit 1
VDSLIHFLFLPLALMMKFSLFLNDEIEQKKKNQETSEDEKFFFHEIEEYC